MNVVYFLICAAISIAAALGFIALGMKIANENNKRAWEKYYEGCGKKSGQYARADYNPSVVPFDKKQRVAR